MTNTTTTVETKDWTDSAFPIALEALIVLAGDYYIISRELQVAGFVSVPFVIGLLITSGVGIFALHWVFSKKHRWLVGSSFTVWLVATACILITSGLDWQADHKIQAHAAEVTLAADTKAKTTAAETASKLQLLDKGKELLNGTKDKSERAAILAAVGVSAAKPAKTGPPSEDAISPGQEWRPFQAGTFADWWYNGVSNFMGLIGAALGALLVFAKVVTRTDFATSATGKPIVTTQHEITTATQQIGFAAPVVAQTSNDPRNHSPTSPKTKRLIR